jgi:hypothetical protein
MLNAPFIAAASVAAAYTCRWLLRSVQQLQQRCSALTHGCPRAGAADTGAEQQVRRVVRRRCCAVCGRLSWGAGCVGMWVHVALVMRQLAFDARVHCTLSRSCVTPVTPAALAITCNYSAAGCPQPSQHPHTCRTPATPHLHLTNPRSGGRQQRPAGITQLLKPPQRAPPAPVRASTAAGQQQPWRRGRQCR